jgi:hypothetical protein
MRVSRETTLNFLIIFKDFEQFIAYQENIFLYIFNITFEGKLIKREAATNLIRKRFTVLFTAWGEKKNLNGMECLNSILRRFIGKDLRDDKTPMRYVRGNPRLSSVNPSGLPDHIYDW